MVFWQLLSLTNLLKTQVFCIHEALKVIVVCKHKNFMFTAFKVMLLCFKSLDNGQKLIIVGFIPSFSQNHFLKEKSYQMLLAQIIQSQLTENPPNNIARYICFNLDMTSWIKII